MAHRKIKPFWEIIPDIFRYPAKGESLVTCGLYAFLWLFALMPSLLGTVIAIGLTAATYRFAYSVLVHTSRGNLEPPQNHFSYVSGNVFWKQLGLWLLMGFLVFLIGYALGGFFAICAMIIVLFALPMATIVLAIEQSVFRALNPATWFDGIGRIGAPYITLVLFLVLFLASSATLVSYVAPAFPFLIGYVIANFISMYFLVAMFFLMGYVIYQYHEDFGWEPDEQLDELPTLERANPLLAQADALIETGQLAEAKDHLKKAISHEGPMSEVATRYWRLLKATGDGEALTVFARQHLEALLQLGEKDRALALIVDCNEIDPDFKFRDGEHCLTFMEMAAERGQHANVVALAKGFTKRYPKHSKTPNVMLLTAKTLSERMGRDDAAFKIVSQARRAFRNHDLGPEFERLHQLLAPPPAR